MMKVNGYVATISITDPTLIDKIEKLHHLGGFLNREKHTVRAWVRTVHTDECQKDGTNPGRSWPEDFERYGFDSPWFNMGHYPAWSILRGCKLCGTVGGGLG